MKEAFTINPKESKEFERTASEILNISNLNLNFSKSVVTKKDFIIKTITSEITTRNKVLGVEENDFERLLASLPEEDETPRRRIIVTVGGNLGLASDRSDDIWSIGVVSATKAPEMEFNNATNFFYGLPLSKKAAFGETNSVRSSAFRYRHNFPVSARIAISYPFSERIAAETGISYTLLSSSILSPSASGTETSMQTLHFIGLPVNLRYTLYEIGRSSLYASAGGAMEKCVSAKRFEVHYRQQYRIRQGR